MIEGSDMGDLRQRIRNCICSFLDKGIESSMDNVFKLLHRSQLPTKANARNNTEAEAGTRTDYDVQNTKPSWYMRYAAVMSTAPKPCQVN
jgi:hypothetical protein